MGKCQGGLDEEGIEHGLAILGVGAEVRKIGAITFRCGHTPVHFGIYTAVERSDTRRPKLCFQLLQGNATRIAQNKVKIPQSTRTDVGRVARPALSSARVTGYEIVKYFQCAARLQKQILWPAIPSGQ